MEDTHPGARETDPFFTNAQHMSQDETQDARYSRSFGAAARDLSPESTWQPEIASAKSAHPMNPSVVRRSSNAVSIGGRSAGRGSRARSSSTQSQRRIPTRTDSGREFLGLPEPPRRKMTFEDLAEDSSEDEDEGEWVSFGRISGSCD